MKVMKNDIPILKIFTYDNKCFMYEPYSNYLYKISKEQFLELNRLKKIGLDAYKNLNENTEQYYDILFLIEKGLI